MSTRTVSVTRNASTCGVTCQLRVPLFDTVFLRASVLFPDGHTHTVSLHPYVDATSRRCVLQLMQPFACDDTESATRCTWGVFVPPLTKCLTLPDVDVGGFYWWRTASATASALVQSDPNDDSQPVYGLSVLQWQSSCESFVSSTHLVGRIVRPRAIATSSATTAVLVTVDTTRNILCDDSFGIASPATSGAAEEKTEDDNGHSADAFPPPVLRGLFLRRTPKKQGAKTTKTSLKAKKNASVQQAVRVELHFQRLTGKHALYEVRRVSDAVVPKRKAYCARRRGKENVPPATNNHSQQPSLLSILCAHADFYDDVHFERVTPLPLTDEVKTTTSMTPTTPTGATRLSTRSLLADVLNQRPSADALSFLVTYLVQLCNTFGIPWRTEEHHYTATGLLSIVSIVQDSEQLYWGGVGFGRDCLAVALYLLCTRRHQPLRVFGSEWDNSRANMPWKMAIRLHHVCVSLGLFTVDEIPPFVCDDMTAHLRTLLQDNVLDANRPMSFFTTSIEGNACTIAPVVDTFLQHALDVNLHKLVMLCQTAPAYSKVRRDIFCSFVR